MENELDALLEAIRESPLDDLSRLALSDWCMEQSDPVMQARGELIQLRARAALLPAESPERGQMERRVVVLRQQYETQWLGGLQQLVAGWDFERGMILLEIRSGGLNSGQLARMANQPGWRWVIGLKGILLTPAESLLFAHSPLLANLTSLDLCDCELGPRGVRELAVSPSLSYLASLKLGYTGCRDEGAVALAESPRLVRMTVLTLFNNAIGAEGARALSASANLGRLMRLELSRNPIGNEGAQMLAHSPNLPNLSHLALESCGIGDRGGIAFVDTNQRERLQLLDLRDNAFKKATRGELRERYATRVLLSE